MWSQPTSVCVAMEQASEQASEQALERCWSSGLGAGVGAGRKSRSKNDYNSDQGPHQDIYVAFSVASVILGSNRNVTDIFFWDNSFDMLCPSMGSSTMPNTVDLNKDYEDASRLSRGSSSLRPILLASWNFC